MTTYKSSIIPLLLIIGACTAAVNYTEIPAAQYSKYPLIPTLRTLGVNQVLNNAVRDGKVQNNQFSLVSNNHIYLGVNGTFSYYKYDLSLKNIKSDQLNTTFEIRYDTKTKKALIVATQYSVKYAPTNGTNTNTTTPTTPTNPTNPTNPPNNTNNTGNPSTNQTTPGYVLVPSAQYNSTLISGLAKFGAGSIVSSGISKGKLPAGDYSVTSISSVSRQVLKSVINYKFVVVVTKSDATRVVDANYTIAYTPSTGKQAITASGYSVRPFST